MTTAAVEFDDVSFSFDNESVLENVSFSCAAGSITAILGRSGAGKTTVLNLAAGLLTAAQGSVRVSGRSPRWATTHQRIGYVFQKANLFPWLTAFENVSLPLEVGRKRALPQSEIKSRVDHALERMKISEAFHKYPSELSGGMQTRVALARALVHEPDVLLLDEAFASLDDMTREEIYWEVQVLLAEGNQSATLVTHNLVESILLADQILICGRKNLAATAASTIVAKLDVSLPRPRDASIVSTEQFAKHFSELHSLMRATA